MKEPTSIWGIIEEKSKEYHYLIKEGIMSVSEAFETGNDAFDKGLNYQDRKFFPDKVGIVIFSPNTYPETPQILKKIIIKH